MKPFRLAFIFVVLLLLSCGSVPHSITNGEWHYDLIVNRVKAGKATITSRQEGGLYITKTEMSVSMGTINNSTVQTTTEKLDFTPVKLEIYNTIEDSANGSKLVISKIAEFDGDTVTLKSGAASVKRKLETPFIIEGNYFYDCMIREKFRKGLELRARLYEPTVKIDGTILVIVNVLGREKIKVNGKETETIHIKQRVEKLKSVDIYINENGVTEKIIMKMLNNVFELERTD